MTKKYENLARSCKIWLKEAIDPRILPYDGNRERFPHLVKHLQMIIDNISAPRREPSLAPSWGQRRRTGTLLGTHPACFGVSIRRCMPLILFVSAPGRCSMSLVGKGRYVEQEIKRGNTVKGLSRYARIPAAVGHETMLLTQLKPGAPIWVAIDWEPGIGTHIKLIPEKNATEIELMRRCLANVAKGNETKNT